MVGCRTCLPAIGYSNVASGDQVRTAQTTVRASLLRLDVTLMLNFRPLSIVWIAFDTTKVLHEYDV
jgi:hypothetical protein